MNVVSWNVNGLRSVIGYSPWCHSKKHQRLHSMLEYFKSDIICLQETKISRSKLTTDITTVKGYITFYSFCNTRPSYSGVATFIRESSLYIKPIKAQDGFSSLLRSNNNNKDIITSKELLNKLKESFTENRLKELDNEGRCLITDHSYFLLLNIYFPNGGDSTKTDRILFKKDYHQCITIIIQYFINIEKRNVILLGDLNAKYQLIDCCDPNQAKIDFYQRESTKWFQHLINDENGPKMIDTFKYIHPDFSKLDKAPNTCWDTYTFARGTNFGTRIDYILINNNDKYLKINDAKVMQSIKGSDHCPISCKIIIDIDTKEKEKDNNKNNQNISIPRLASRFMPEFSGKQTNITSFFGNNKNKNNNNKSRKRKFNDISCDNISDNKNKSGIIKKRQKLNQSNLWGFITKENNNNNNSKKMESDEVEPEILAQIAKMEATSNEKKKKSSSEEWKNLFGKKKSIPICKHNEKCVLRTVIKEGFNKGKKFYVCRRGKGAPGDKNGQCNFFQWLDKPAKLRKNVENK